MRYFLATLLDQETKAYVRDVKRSLDKFKRNINFVPLDELHFNYKYLGEDLSPELVTELTRLLANFVNTYALKSFSYPLTRLEIGRPMQISPHALRMELVNSPELNQLMRKLHELVAPVEGVKRSKDDNRLLGVIKLAKLKPNINSKQHKEIESIIRELPLPGEMQVNNFSIIKSTIVRDKVNYITSGRVDLLEG